MSETEGTMEELTDAIGRGDAERVRELVEDDPGLAASRTPAGIPVARAAIYAGHPGIADLLLRHGADPDAFTAAALGRTDRLEALLDRGEVRLGDRSEDGWTPLHLAAYFGHVDTVRALLDRGADPSPVSENEIRNTPLHAAASAGRLPIVEALVERDADVNAAAAEGLTPLDIACGQRHDEITRLLVETGARKARRGGSS